MGGRIASTVQSTLPREVSAAGGPGFKRRGRQRILFPAAHSAADRHGTQSLRRADTGRRCHGNHVQHGASPGEPFLEKPVLTTPGGAETNLIVSLAAPDRLRVSFPAQITEGFYTLLLPPGVQNQFGESVPSRTTPNSRCSRRGRPGGERQRQQPGAPLVRGPGLGLSTPGFDEPHSLGCVGAAGRWHQPNGQPQPRGAAGRRSTEVLQGRTRPVTSYAVGPSKPGLRMASVRSGYKPGQHPNFSWKAWLKWLRLE